MSSCWKLRFHIAQFENHLCFSFHPWSIFKRTYHFNLTHWCVSCSVSILFLLPWYQSPEYLSQCYRQEKRCHGRVLWMKIKSKQKKGKSRLRTTYFEETSLNISQHQMRIDFAFTASVEKWSFIQTNRISCSIRWIYQCKGIQTENHTVCFISSAFIVL